MRMEDAHKIHAQRLFVCRVCMIEGLLSEPQI
jgi:hypothetical protein